MPPLFLARLASAGLLLWFAATHAQPERGAGRADPANPGAAVPATQYRSAFENYRPLRDEPVSSWRENNDLVGRIGGWRVYARETAPPSVPERPSLTPEPPSPGPARPSSSPAGAGHQGHGGHR